MRTYIQFLVVLIVVALASSAISVEYDEDQVAHQITSRKRPSLFHRAKKGSPAEQLAYARSMRDAASYQNAARQYAALVHTWHGSEEAPQAQLEHALLLESRRKYEPAFDEYQYLIDHFNGGFPYDDVLARQFRIANQVMTSNEKFLIFFSSDENLRLALPMFRLVVDNGPNWKKAVEAQFNIGLIHERLGDYTRAIGAYEAAEQRYAATPMAIAATFRKGYCLYVLAGKSPYDEHSSQVARGDLQRFVRNHPDHESVKTSKEYIAELNGRLAKMYYERAVFYDKRSKRPRSALIAYTDFVSKFPEAATAAAAHTRIAELKSRLESESSEKPESE